MTIDFRYIISSNLSVYDALKALNELSADVLTLFIVNNEKQLVGTLTDGDIRRSLVSGIDLSESVTKIMHKNYVYVTLGRFSVEELRSIKKKGIKLLPLLDEYKRIIKIYNLRKLNSILPIDAVLMAGGKGERLRPLTLSVPKPLLKVGEKPIIDYNVERLISYGVTNINVTVNYLGEQIQSHFEKPIRGVSVKTVKEPKFLGTMGSISFVDTLVNDTVLVMNSDLFTNIDYEDFYLHFKNNNADMSIAAVPYSVDVPYGIFDLEGRVVKGVKEKPTYNYYANSGIYLIKKQVLELIPEGEYFNATDLIDLLIKREKKVIRFPLVGYWIDIGKPVDFQKAQEFVKHL